MSVKNYGPVSSHPPEVISQDPEHRFVTDAQIQQWTNGTAGQGQFMALVFRRSMTVPATPAGGTFNFPIPDGGLWTNTILPGIEPVFVSTRFFTSDGAAPQQAGWNPPVLFVKHGDSGPPGPKGDKGDPGQNGLDGAPGQNGADGINGQDGTPIRWLGEAASHPIWARNGQAYKNTTNGVSYVFQDDVWYQMTVDGIDGQDGVDGLPIVWKGDLVTPPLNPVLNWVYRDTNNHRVYIWNGIAWELMVLDGNDGAAGAPGANGLSVYITYHDADPQGVPPVLPTNAAGTNNGWHTNATSAVGWMSQKVDDGTGIGWGLPIPIRGASGPRGSHTFTLDAADPGTTYITPATAAAWASALTDVEARNVARDIILTFSADDYLRPSDRITITNRASQVVGTRIYQGASTNDYTSITANQFSSLVTEVVDGSLLVKGTVGAKALAADVISGGKIIGDLLRVTNAEIEGQIKSDVNASNGQPMWELNKNGSLILRATDGSIVLQSGGKLDYANVSGVGRPADFATQGKNLALPFESWSLNGQSIWASTNGFGKVGLKSLFLSGAGFPNQGNYIPIDPTKTYRTRFWAAVDPVTDGVLYFSLRQFTDANGTPGPVNGGRSPYKPSGQTAAAHNATYGGWGWGEYSYTWTAADWQAGVKFVQPEFLGNYGGTVGGWYIQDFTFEEITEITQAAQTADWGSVSNKTNFAALTGPINSTNISTYMADAAIGNAQIGTAAIRSAQIGTAAVGTLHIGTDQVVIPRTYSLSTGVACHAGETVVGSVSIDSGGQPVQIIAMVNSLLNTGSSGNNGVGLRVYRGDLLVADSGIIDSGFDPNVDPSQIRVVMGLDSPGTGTHVYSLRFYSSARTWNISNRNLILLGVKR